MKQAPIWVWLTLLVAVFGVSSAGAILQHLDEIPPLMRASWRLQITALLLMPMAIWQWSKSSEEVKEKCKSWSSVKLLLLSGMALAVHFGAWVWSLDLTSLTHSLLFVTAHPLVIVFGLMLFVRKPNKLESSGAIIGFIGACVTLLDVSSDGSVSILGDMLAFAGAIAVVGYIVVGRILRPWMPLFLYATPVTAIAAILLIPMSIIFGESTQPFGWIQSDLFFWFLLLAIFAGIFGHTGLNACLRYLTPLTISVAVTFEPLLGSLIGWVFFDTPSPQIWTLLGGPLLITGMILVILGGDKHQSSGGSVPEYAQTMGPHDQ
ncbi:MAG: hypothetical protein CMB51_02115 [Euryarchaeota archaeon]|nr:hypothetical protein [Euryarchaeota archaeon]DAC16456.1 MAG TPA: DMT family transporter [Candidatus Poseidoniales archaeon]HII62919.1 DMT family transporter [Candidatus Poseidoniaceae archaeon]